MGGLDAGTEHYGAHHPHYPDRPTGAPVTFRQATTPTDETRRLHTALNLPLPPRILHLDTDPAATR